MAEPVPVSKANMDPVFEARIGDLQKQAADEVKARSIGGQVLWSRPRDWAGDVFNLASFAPPFSRAASNADYLSATRDAAAPGTTGDLVASTTQIDYLATLERACRNRHTMRRPRATAHALARWQGLGSKTGPLGDMLEQVRDVLRLAKEPPK